VGANSALVAEAHILYSEMRDTRKPYIGAIPVRIRACALG